MSTLETPIFFVDDKATYDAFLTTLSEVPVCSLDLEFDKNYHRYGFNLCLIQIAIGSECFLINPLNKTIDLTRLFRLLESPALKKVVFSFGEDLRLLHSLHCFPVHIVDLNFYARLLNYPQVSLTNLAAELLAVDLASGEQLSNWYDRPLSEGQIRYAANDVIYLQSLYEKLHGLAVQKGVLTWAEQENRSYEQADFSEKEEKRLFKEKERRAFNQFSWHIYRELLVWRDEKARQLDLPPFKAIDKSTLSGLAAKPDRIERWKQISGIHPELKNYAVHAEVKSVLTNAANEAKRRSLSLDKPAVEEKNPEDMKEVRKEQARINKVKRSLFKPVKQCVSRDYGDETSAFIFSNRIITEFVRENSSEMLPYKVDLIRRYAAELHLKPEIYLSLPQ